MRFHWDRLGRLGVPLAIAALFAIILQELVGVAPRWAIPAGLWVALQVNNVFIAPKWQAAAAKVER